MKAKKIDQTIREKIKESESKDSNFLIWEKKKSWLKISELLDHKQTKVVVWMCSMAASLSLVFGQPVQVIKSWFSPSVIQHEISENYTSINSTVHNSSEIESKITSPNIVLIKLETKSPTNTEISDLKVKADVLKVNSNLNEPEMAVYNEHKITTNTQLFANYTGHTVGAGIRLNIQKRISPNKSGLNTLGISIDYSPSFSLNNSINDEIARTNHEFYIGVIAGNEDKWYTTASYNVLTNQEYDSMPSIRLAYLHRIAKSFYLGPELRFSSTFKQIYPSITLTLG
jgi:hypothetical protein